MKGEYLMPAHCDNSVPIPPDKRDILIREMLRLLKRMEPIFAKTTRTRGEIHAAIARAEEALK